MSVRTRFLLLFLTALIPALLVTVWTSLEQHKQARVDTEENTLRLTRIASAEQEQLINGTRQLLIALASFPEVTQGDGTACSQRLAELGKNYPQYASLVVVKPNGDAFCSAAPLPQPINVSDQSYFQRVVATRDFAVGDYLIGRITGKPIVVAGYPIFEANGNIRALVAAGIDLSWLSHLAERAQLPPGSVFSVTDSTGKILVRYPDPAGLVGQVLPAFKDGKAIPIRGEESVLEGLGADGIRRIYAFAPLSGTSNELYASMAVPLDLALAPANQVQRHVLSALALFALFGLAVVWFGGNRFVLQGMDDLLRTAKQMTDGDLSARTRMSYRAELGSVARALDELAIAFDQLIGRHKLTEAELRENEDRYRAVVENVAEAIAISVESKRVFVNKAFLTVHGLSDVSQVISLPTDHFVVPEDKTALIQRQQARLRGEPVPTTSEFRIARPDGAVRTLLASTTSIVYQGKAATLAVLRDITERKRLEEELQHKAMYDGLTELPNRTLFLERVKETVLSTKPGTRAGLLLIDIDRFKEVNDTFGHATGDALLQQIGPLLLSVLPEDTMLARLGGDEFAVLAPGADAERATQIAKMVLTALKSPFAVESQYLGLDASIGIVLSPEHGADAQTLLRRADVAMYQAKRSSSGYQVYAQDQDHHTPDRLALLGELREAMEQGQLLLYYQPQIDLQNGNMVAVEALARWNHPRFGLLLADAFVPLAEGTGVIHLLSDWVLNQALRQAKVWAERDHPIKIAVNLSARDIHNPQLPDQIATLLKRYHVGANLLQVEITESSLMIDPLQALDVLVHLSKLGVTISIDDFGTGFSSLSYLQRLPVDEVKIDRSFMTTMFKGTGNQAIVRSIIDLGHNLGLRVVAEGVEDYTVRDELARLGCDAAQGFYLGAPVPAAEIMNRKAKNFGPLSAANAQTDHITRPRGGAHLPVS